METLTLIFWIVVAAGAIGFVFWFVKGKKKKPVEKEIFSAPLDTGEPKVKPAEMPRNNEGVEEEEEEYKEE